MTQEQFRKALLLFSIKDQGADWRDAIVALDRLCGLAVRSRLSVVDVLADVAALSSDEPPFPAFTSCRSTRTLLLEYSGRFRGVPQEGSDSLDTA
jgi:hypothetical protein